MIQKRKNNNNKTKSTWNWKFVLFFFSQLSMVFVIFRSSCRQKMSQEWLLLHYYFLPLQDGSSGHQQIYSSILETSKDRCKAKQDQQHFFSPTIRKWITTRTQMSTSVNDVYSEEKKKKHPLQMAFNHHKLQNKHKRWWMQISMSQKALVLNRYSKLQKLCITPGMHQMLYPLRKF